VGTVRQDREPRRAGCARSAGGGHQPRLQPRARPDGRTSAWDVWQLRKGVCRDYAHLAIAFCRALSIPARYIGGYAVGLEPMNFHACFEAYLGGQWYLFDPTDQIPPEDIVIIARGRDATNAALTTIFGKVQITPVTVTAGRIEPAPRADPTPAG